jgi:hypothetical protein
VGIKVQPELAQGPLGLGVDLAPINEAAVCRLAAGEYIFRHV